MATFDYLDNMRDEDAALFKRSIRKLLDSTFIVEDRDERLYAFLASETNAYNVSAYLRIIGYDLVVKDELKVAMLVQNEEDMETVGIKRISLLRFDDRQVSMLLVLWLMYLERVGFAEEIYVTVGDIIDKLKLYGISLTPTEFRAAFAVFKRFNLIYFSGDDNRDEDGKVKLYPSLQFCMDIEQLKQVMEKLGNNKSKANTVSDLNDSDNEVDDEEEPYV